MEGSVVDRVLSVEGEGAFKGETVEGDIGADTLGTGFDTSGVQRGFFTCSSDNPVTSTGEDP